MRDRHKPRVCRACSAPLARQEDRCWRCGTQWTSEDAPSIESRQRAMTHPVATERKAA